MYIYGGGGTQAVVYRPVTWTTVVQFICLQLYSCAGPIFPTGSKLEVLSRGTLGGVLGELCCFIFLVFVAEVSNRRPENKVNRLCLLCVCVW